MKFKSDKKVHVMRMAQHTNKVDIRFTVEDIRNVKDEELIDLIKNHLPQEIEAFDKELDKYDWRREMKGEREIYETVHKPLILSLLSESKQQEIEEKLNYANSIEETNYSQAADIRQEVQNQLYDLLWQKTQNTLPPTYIERPREIVKQFMEDIVL